MTDPIDGDDYDNHALPKPGTYLEIGINPSDQEQYFTTIDYTLRKVNFHAHWTKRVHTLLKGFGDYEFNLEISTTGS